MQERVNINVSTIDYRRTSREIESILDRLAEMVHCSQDDFIVTESEFAFGWHFFVVSVNREMVIKLQEQLGQDFDKLKGKGMEKKFLTWLTRELDNSKVPRFKLAIKEEMESSKYGIF